MNEILDLEVETVANGADVVVAPIERRLAEDRAAPSNACARRPDPR